MGWKPTRTFLPAGQSLTPGGHGEEWPEGPLFKSQNFTRKDGQGKKGGDERKFGGGGWDRTRETSTGRKTQTQGSLFLLPGSHPLSPLGQRTWKNLRWDVWEGRKGLGGAA